MNLDARNAKAQGQGQPRASHDVDEEENMETSLSTKSDAHTLRQCVVTGGTASDSYFASYPDFKLSERCVAGCRRAQWVGTSSRAPTGGRVLEGVIKLPLSPPQARKFWRYGL